MSLFCQKIIDCQGTTLFTGVGKTSFIAKKVCQTLASTGTRSMWLAPVDALHGDIGNVQAGDVLVMLSKSGETVELTTLLPYAKAKGAFVVACTDNKESTLALKADMHVYLPSDGEVTPFPDESGNDAERDAERGVEASNNEGITGNTDSITGTTDSTGNTPGSITTGSNTTGTTTTGNALRTTRTPTGPLVTYTATQLLFGDTCAVYLMELRGLTQNQYALNHPAGRIGKRLVLKVTDVMKGWEELPLAKPAMNGMEALVQMAGTSKGCGCLLVVDDSRKLLGTFSDADLRRALTKRGAGEILTKTVQQLMNFDKEYPRTIADNAMAFDAHVRMEQGGNSVDYLPVVSTDGTRTLMGLVTMRGLAECGM